MKLTAIEKKTNLIDLSKLSDIPVQHLNVSR